MKPVCYFLDSLGGGLFDNNDRLDSLTPTLRVNIFYIFFICDKKVLSHRFFSMTPYGCLSTGDMVGLIEVVLDSTTLANIQKRKGGGVTKGAFVRSSLLDYIKEYNPDEERYVKFFFLMKKRIVNIPPQNRNQFVQWCLRVDLNGITF